MTTNVIDCIIDAWRYAHVSLSFWFVFILMNVYLTDDKYEANFIYEWIATFLYDWDFSCIWPTTIVPLDWCGQLFFACYYPLTVSHPNQISALYIILPLSYKEHITKKNHFFMRCTRKIKFLDYNKIREKGFE